VIQLKKVAVRGKSEAGDFSGSLEFAGGLQVISAKNAYGKSLAVKSVTWCLGLDPMFGNAENDPIPEAVREDLELAGHKSRVLNSECSITLKDDKGRTLEITRAITGGDPRIVEVREKATSEFRLSSGKKLGTLIVTIPTHVGWKQAGQRTKVSYVVEFTSIDNQALGTSTVHAGTMHLLNAQGKLSTMPGSPRTKSNRHSCARSSAKIGAGAQC
jgi:hypothetical protein